MVFNVAKSKFNAEKMTYSSECEYISNEKDLKEKDDEKEKGNITQFKNP